MNAKRVCLEDSRENVAGVRESIDGLSDVFRKLARLQKILWYNTRILDSQKDENDVYDPTKETPIDKLPEDCLIHIFLYLSPKERMKMEKVCKRWLDISSKRAWFKEPKSLHLYYDPSLNDRGLRKRDLYTRKLLKRSGRFLKKLTIQQLKTQRIMRVIRDNCQNLTEINLSFDSHPVIIDPKLFSDMKVLRKVHIRSPATLRHSYRVTMNYLEFVKELPNTVEEIHLSGNTSRPSPSRGLDFRGLPSLHSLYISHCQLSNRDMQAISQTKTLVCLYLSECRIEQGLKLLPALTNLEQLYFNGGIRVDDDLLASFADNCKKLKCLDISFCFSVTDVGINHLIRMENLENLIMDNMGSISQVPYGSKLKLLSSCHCEDLSHASINRLLQYSPNLSELYLLGCFISTDCLFSANSIMKNRTNNVELHITTESIYVRRFLRRVGNRNHSPLLVLDNWIGYNAAPV